MSERILGYRTAIHLFGLNPSFAPAIHQHCPPNSSSLSFYCPHSVTSTSPPSQNFKYKTQNEQQRARFKVTQPLCGGFGSSELLHWVAASLAPDFSKKHAAFIQKCRTPQPQKRKAASSFETSEVSNPSNQRNNYEDLNRLTLRPPSCCLYTAWCAAKNAYPLHESRKSATYLTCKCPDVMEQTNNRKPRWLPLTSTATTVTCMSFSAAGDKEPGASLAKSVGVPALYGLLVTLCTASLTLTNTTFCPHSCIYVFCVDLRTNSDYCCLCTCILIVRPCILNVVYIFLLFVRIFLTLSIYSYCSSVYS
jgi:hypothetical protein